MLTIYAKLLFSNYLWRVRAFVERVGSHLPADRNLHFVCVMCLAKHLLSNVVENVFIPLIHIDMAAKIGKPKQQQQQQKHFDNITLYSQFYVICNICIAYVITYDTAASNNIYSKRAD